MPLTQTPSIFTVSRLNQSVRLLLEQEMGQVWISGEISNFTQPASGHWYFTLKDDTAQVRCAMFRNSNRRVTFRPQHGQQVLVRANITLYSRSAEHLRAATIKSSSKACSPPVKACCNSVMNSSSSSSPPKGCSIRR
ncbi:Exodeoxyribonuclease VII large subunit [Cronobacter turicensis 564]|nr:Exodeoxyribonuclease VII large subunit [Cronobacter turicensis 564]